MAGFLISCVLEQLSSILGQEPIHQLNLITGVEQEVQALTSNLQAIKAVLEDAEKRQVNDSAVKLWLSKLKDVAYDIDDILDEWNTAILKRQIQQEHGPPPKKARFSVSTVIPSFLLPWPRQLVKRHETAAKVEELNKRLADIAHEKSVYSFTVYSATLHEQRERTSSVFDESRVFAREEDKKIIKHMLLCDQGSSSQGKTAAPRVVSVVGMGGLGKTTLARLAYNDSEVESHFEKRIWVCVSDPFDVERIAIGILESLEGSKPNLAQMDNILRGIRERVTGKKILLVLDDVWTEDSSNWEQLKGCFSTSSPGSRILVTTRNEMVALKGMGSRKEDIFLLGKLPEDKCWSLFCHLAFVDRTTEEQNNLEDIGREIVKRCQGLPLAVKILGGVLRFKAADQWQSILDSSRMWEIEEDLEIGVFCPLLLSYYDLPPVLRQCFSYCAIFPQDYRIEKKKLIKLWMAQGFLKETRNKGMEIVGEEYFNKLAMCSFFQDFERDKNNDIIRCKMHDIVHDFAQKLMKNECLLIDSGDKKEAMPDSSLGTIRHSIWDCAFPIPMGSRLKLRTLLIKFHWWSRHELNLWNSIYQLTCLRAVELSGLQQCFPSNEIGNLIHLRYLDLSEGRFDSLPAALCELCNLQTLDITGCTALKELPLGIEKLINLEHLENERTYLDFMPRGLERLTRLRTLTVFSSRPTLESKSCRLEGLGKLTHLHGSLRLNLTTREAAPLSGMTGIRQLFLLFKCDEMQDEELILQAFQPPPKLAALDIEKITGPTLFIPDLMMSLMNLKRVELKCCRELESLPPMGKLPYLEHLNFYELKKVKKVGEEFLGIERRDLGQTTSSSSIAFPKLKTLGFFFMWEWEDWEYGRLLSENYTIMPLLSSLDICGCPKLKELPQHLQNTPTLQNLEISDCYILYERYKEGGKDRHLISHIPNILVWPPREKILGRGKKKKCLKSPVKGILLS